MAASIKPAESSSIVQQFSFCEICRFNHTDFKTHSYSKRHRDSVNKILQRFLVKVDEVKAIVANPQIQEEYHERNVNVWCYFCRADVPKHRMEQGNSVICGRLLHHLKSVQHLKKCKTFWWENKIDSACNDVNRYVIKDVDYQTFQINVTKAKEDYMKKRKLTLKQDADLILELESQRKEYVQSCRAASEPVMNRNEQPSTSTAGALHTSDEKLNIFTGMLPPWLHEHDDISHSIKEARPIHPNMDDLDKHLKLTRKKKLPAERVGANFDHEGARSDNWLPSFGRVWNNGRRLATKKQFEAEPQQPKRHRPRSLDDDPTFPRSAAAKPPPNLNKYVL